MNSILEEIIAHKKKEVEERKQRLPFSSLMKKAESTFSGPSLKDALTSGSSPAIIAEFKRKSPSKGVLNEKASVQSVITGYTAYGASAISVLTDEKFFGGSWNDLHLARQITDLPVLCKDFIIDQYQLWEAKAAGADVILLVAAALDRKQLHMLAERACDLDLEVLLEIHNEQELDTLHKNVTLVGVNNRNLSTFSTSVDVSLKLADKIPADFIKIAESGIASADTIITLYKAGYKGFLIGEHFMRHPDPPVVLHQLRQDIMNKMKP